MHLSLRTNLAPTILCTLTFIAATGCEDENASPICEKRECGYWGEYCGDCPPREFCNPDGLCESACTDRQCGTWHGVDCGACPSCRYCDNLGHCQPHPLPDPPPCEDPTAEGICINGWVRYLFDPEQPSNFMTTLAARPDETADGTRHAVIVYDLLAYTLDPDTADPLSVAEVDPACGTFRAPNIPVPPQGLLAMATSDCAPSAGRCEPFAGGTDPSSLVFTAVPLELFPATNMTRVEAVAITVGQVEKWSVELGITNLEGAGCPPESDLLTCGTCIASFRKGSRDQPGPAVEGVVLEDSLGALPPEWTFYPGVTSDGEVVFDDPAEQVVWSDPMAPHEHTGIYGTVFAPNLDPRNLTGRCARDTACEASGCVWDSSVGGSVPGAMLVHFVEPVTCTNP